MRKKKDKKKGKKGWDGTGGFWDGAVKARLCQEGFRNVCDKLALHCRMWDAYLNGRSPGRKKEEKRGINNKQLE